MGLNYTDHSKVYRFEYAQRHLPGLDADNRQEANLQLPKAPILFTMPRTAPSDPYPAAINIPKCAQDGTSDYEAELCVVIWQGWPGYLRNRRSRLRLGLHGFQ